MEEERKNTATSDYSIMMDMFKQAKEEYEMYKDLMVQGLESDDVSFARAEFLFKAYTKEDIEKLDFETAYEMLTKIRKPENPNSDEKRKSDSQWVEDLCFDVWSTLHDSDKEDGYDYESMKHDLIIKMLIRFKADMDELENSKKQVEDLQKQVDEVTDDYQNFMCSEEYDEAQRKKIEKLREQVEKQKNKADSTFSERQENRINEKKIKELEAILDNSYILTRLNTVGEKEVQNIVNAYFDKKRSSYIIERFKTKITSIGFKPEIYRFFFNIEEKYLDEEYHVFNNLFLFIAMRYIGYSDTGSSTNKAYCRHLISSISKLIYEKFSDTQKERFLNTVKEVLNHFKPYYEKFDKDNIVHPKHPRRIQKDKEQLEEFRNTIITTLKSKGKEIPEDINEYSAEKLRDWYMEKLDEIEKERKEKELEGIPEFLEKVKPSVTEESESESEEESSTESKNSDDEEKESVEVSEDLSSEMEEMQ